MPALQSLAPSAYSRFSEFLRAELAMYPGRLSLILRIACACSLSMGIIMTFHIPSGALGAYYPLLLAHDNPRATLRAATRTAIACSLGTLELIVGAMLLVADPATHLLWVAGNLFLVFFLISTLEAYDIALAFGLLVSSAITVWDLPVSAEQRLTKTLFILLSILIGCVISVVIEYVFAGTHRPDAIIDGIRTRFMAAGEVLLAFADQQPPDASVRSTLSRYAIRGTGDLRERLARADYEQAYKDQLSAALALSGRLIELAAHLAESDVNASEADSAFCRATAAKIDWICTRLHDDEAPEWLDITEQDLTVLPVLVEIERTVELVTEVFHSDPDEAFPLAHLPAPGERGRKRFFLPDVFSNGEHARFAIRGSLSAVVCYLAYMSVGWIGLNAAIATCILSALKNTGAARHKQMMRFSGMLIGAGVLGYFSQSVLLPQIDSIQSFAFLFAAVVALGAWVGTSSPRLAHAGAQMVLAYDLVNLNSFAMNPSLVPARDTILGILLGIAAMWLIFDHLWTKSTPDSLRELLFCGVDGIARLDIDSSADSIQAQEACLWAACEKLTRIADNLRNLADYATFEVHPHEEDERLIAWIREFQPHLRAVMMVKSGLLHHRILAGETAPDHIIDQVCRRSSELLQDALQWLEGEPGRMTTDLSGDDPLAGLVKQLREEAPAWGEAELATEMRLCSSLLYLSRELRDCSRQWYEARPVPAF